MSRRRRKTNLKGVSPPPSPTSTAQSLHNWLVSQGCFLVLILRLTRRQDLRAFTLHTQTTSHTLLEPRRANLTHKTSQAWAHRRVKGRHDV